MLGLALIIGLVAGCGEGETDEPQFAAFLSLENSSGGDQSEFQPGETIRFSASLANFTETGQVLGFTFEPFFDVIVREAGGADLWRRSDPTGFRVSARTLIFNPNEEKTFPVNWDQVLLDETALPPGFYSAQAVFFPNGSDPFSGIDSGIQTQEVGFTVLEPVE